METDGLRSDMVCGKVKQNNKSLHGICMGKKRNATLRKDGRWQVYAKLKDKRKTCYGKTEYKANYAADIAEAENRGDEAVLERISGDKRFIFENCFYRYRNYLLFYTNVTPETVDRYENTYNRYFPGSILNTMDVRKMDSTAISNFMITILKKYEKLTNREWQRIKHIVKSTIGFIFDEELEDLPTDEIPVIDWEKIKRKASSQGRIYKPVRRQYAVSAPEKQILQDKIINENVYPEKFAHVLMLLINFSLGLRIGELAALKVDDIDMVHHVVYVNKSCKCYKKRDEFGNAVGGYIHTVGVTKTPKGKRMIPMSYNAQKLFSILLQYRREKGYKSQYLAYDGEDARARVKSMSRILKRLCEKTDIDDFTSHIIRKSFATALSCCPDIDIATISEYLGHAQVSTTVNNYLIPARETLEDRIEKLSKMV